MYMYAYIYTYIYIGLSPVGILCKDGLTAEAARSRA